MARLYRVDGRVEHVRPHNGQAFTLDELHQLLACRLVDIARLADGRLLVIDDEAAAAGKPPNRNRALRTLPHLAPDSILGDALLCADGEVSG